MPCSLVKISVIVPIYNMEDHLEQCLDSLTGQTLKEIELLCVNDGSTDSSLDILEKYHAKDPRIRIISKSNSGYGATMNRGLEAAVGEYIGIVEPDDFVELDMFETLYSLAVENNCEIAKSNRYDYKNGEDSFVEVLKGQEYYTVFSPLDNQEFFLLPPSTTTAIYQRDFLKRNGLKYLETPGASFQDTGFAYKALFCATRVILTDQPFYHYRRDRENSSVLSSNKVFSIVEEFRDIDRFLEAHPEVRQTTVSMYGVLRYRAYQWNYRRIDWLYRFAFILAMSYEFGILQDKGELIENSFSSEEWERLNKLIRDPELLFEDEKQRCPYLKLQQKLSAIQKSKSYRIGRLLTYIPRQAKRLVFKK